MTSEDRASAGKTRKWWQRPVTWLLGIVVAAAGAYLTEAIVSGLESVAPADDLVAQAMGTDAIAVVDIRHVDDWFTGRQGYVVPASADPSALLNSEDPAALEKWAVQHGGADVMRTGWEVTLEGKRESAHGYPSTRLALVKSSRPADAYSHIRVCRWRPICG